MDQKLETTVIMFEERLGLVEECLSKVERKLPLS